MELVTNVVATVGGLVTGVMNFFTDRFLTPPLEATLKYLEEAELKTTKGGESYLCYPKKPCNYKKVCFKVVFSLPTEICYAFSLLLNFYPFT